MSELLKKYESIDQSKLNEATIKIINRVKTITADFTADDEKNNKIAEQVLDSVMQKNPDAVKIVKREPKAKPAPKKTHKATHTAKKAHTAKATHTTSSAPKTSNNIMSVAKEIQKAGESWKDAMERAKEVLKERRGEVVQKQKTELEKLYNLVKTKKELQGFANSDINRDAVRTAKVKGARFVSKEGSTSNAYGTFPNKIGRKYWETRDRHSDRLAPNYPKDMPLLASGGGVGSKKYRAGQKFYDTRYDRVCEIVPSNYDGMVSWKRYNKSGTEFENETKHSLVENQFDYLVDMGAYQISKQSMANGGGVSQKKYNTQFNIGEAKYVVNYHDGVKKHKDGSNFYDIAIFKNKKDFEAFLTKLSKEGYREMGYNSSFEKGGIFYKEGSDKYGLGNTEIFIQEENDMYCVYDNVWNEENENWEIKKIADFDTMEEAKEFAIERSKEEYANGGSLPFMTDPNFGNFQNNGMFANGGELKDFEQSVKDALKVPNKWHFITEDVNGKFVQLKMFVGVKDVDVQIFKIDGVHASMPKNYAGKRETLKMIMNNFNANYELGGAFMMTDLAGHTGGSDGLGNPMPLSGVSGTHYTGLVGETGAMSSGELFEAGGAMMQNQQVINDASQSYVNYYLNDGGGVFKDGGSIPNNYEGRIADDVWKNWTEAQRSHFLLDHSELLDNDRMENNLGYTRTVQKDKLFSELTPLTKRVLEAHIRGGQYAYGGKTKSAKPMKELYIEQIASLTGTRTVGVEKFVDDNNLNETELSNLMTGLGRGMISRGDFVTALTGEKGNSIQKEVIAFAKSDKAYKMADGGFMSGVYANGGGIRSKEELKKIFSEKEAIVKNLTPSQIAKMWNENSFGVKEGISKPITIEEAKRPSMKMYLENLLIENELTEEEQAKYFADGGSVDNSVVNELWNGYASALLFTETDSDSGEPLDSEYSISDFDKETVTSTKKMLADYYSENKDAIEESELDLDTIGNDIWYTRSGQGAGFFDHNLDEEVEEKLTNSAKALGEYPSVETYDGKISVRGGKVFAKGGFVGTVEFNVGDVVWDKGNKTYGTVMNNFGDPINGNDGELRLDSDGMQVIFSYDKGYKNRIGYNLVKLGDKGDAGKFTPVVLDELKGNAERMIKYAERAKEKELIKSYKEIYKRTLDGEFDSMVGRAKATSSTKKGSSDYTYVPNKDVKELSVVVKGELKKLMGSDILDGVYVKNSANSAPTKIDETKAHFEKDNNGTVFVDSNFVNQSQNNLPNCELKHYGFGDFYLQTPDGNIDFIRTSEEKEGFVGRTHKLSGSKELIEKLINAMSEKGRFEIKKSMVKKDLNKLVAPKGYVFVNSGSHRATQQINRGDAKYISLYSIGGANTSAGTTIMFMTENDYEKIKGIRGVSPAKNSLPAKSQWFSRKEDKKLDTVFREIEQKESFADGGFMSGVYAKGGMLNKKVNDELNFYLGDVINDVPMSQWIIKTILKSALTDANFHNSSKEVDSIFTKAKYTESAQFSKLQEDAITKRLESKGRDIAKMCDYDAFEIIDSIAFYVSMNMGRPLGEKIENLKNIFADGGFMSGVYAKGGKMQVNNIDAELEDFDIDNLDPFETMQYNQFVKSLGKVGALQVLINSVEGNYSELSPELAELAEKQISGQEWEEQYYRDNGYAKGGSFEDNYGFMRADNENNYRFPERPIHVDTLDEPIDLTDNVSYKSNEVVIEPVDQEMNMNEDGRIRARMTQSNRGSAENFAKINPNSFEFIPMPTSNKHKND